MIILLAACGRKNEAAKNQKLDDSDDFIIAFGSCNNQHIENELWGPIIGNKPDLFIWAGDIIYTDTDDMQLMRKNYQKMKNNAAYRYFKDSISVLGVWDDHDYGMNDGGAYYAKKDSAQQMFLDFFDLDPDDARRRQKGIYFSKLYETGENSVRIILLDTRYFRSDLTKDPEGEKRYVPSSDSTATMLGAAQWEWLEKELNHSKADFNIIVSSIQFLSNRHGYESWGNMPHEAARMKKIITGSGAKGTIILSGDRHLAEISIDSVKGAGDPLVDFTSSGMTHSWTSFNGEDNPYRVSKVVVEKNFGLLRFDFKEKTVKMEIRGKDNVLFQSYLQKY